MAKLVLTLIEACAKSSNTRPSDGGGGSLSDEEVERLGLALLRLSERMDELKRLFGLDDEDLEIDLGPLGRLR